MKKILYSFMLLFMAGSFLTSCSDDDDEGSVVIPSDLTSQVVGTYTGTWSCINKSTGAESTGAGTVTLSEVYQTDDAGNVLVGQTQKNCVTILLHACSAVNLTESEEVANLSWSSNNVYSFFNKSSVTGISIPWAGKINNGTAMDFEFTKSVRSGRLLYEYVYHFTGDRQN